MKLSEAVELYISLRDRKAAIEAEAKEKTAPLTEQMDKLEAKLLQAFDAAGTESVRTKGGTAYVSVRRTMRVADAEVFMTHVRETGNLDLLETRVNKSVADIFLDQHGVLPPGVDLRSERVVNVRRSS